MRTRDCKRRSRKIPTLRCGDDRGDDRDGGGGGGGGGGGANITSKAQ